MSSLYVARVKRDPLWHVLGLLCGAAFVGMLAYARVWPGVLDRVDGSITPHITWLQNLAGVEIFLSITTLGSVTGIILVTLGTAFFLRRSRRSIVRLFYVLAGSALSMSLAKAFVERTRPSVLTWLDPLSSFSFPSGHATLSMALYGFVGVSLYRRANTLAAKAAAVIVPGLIILLVGLSRIVLNYHYLTDVLGGFLLGLFCLSVVYMLPLTLADLGK